MNDPFPVLSVFSEFIRPSVQWGSALPKTPLPDLGLAVHQHQRQSLIELKLVDDGLVIHAQPCAKLYSITARLLQYTLSPKIPAVLQGPHMVTIELPNASESVAQEAAQALSQSGLQLYARYDKRYHSAIGELVVPMYCFQASEALDKARAKRARKAQQRLKC